MRDILLAHAARYPRWLATDVLKLLYQSEFGCGHLLSDREQSLARLLDEWVRVARPMEDMLPIEPIGGGFARANFAACRERGLSPESVHAAFYTSAQTLPGTLGGMLQKAALADALFPDMGIQKAADAWLDAGQPLFSHSPEYRAVYAPAYRVVKEGLITG